MYYHINLLEKHGFISIASTRVVSGIVEKSYQASARNFRVKKGLLNPADEPEDSMAIFVDAMLEDAKQDIKQNAASGLIDLSDTASAMKLHISRTMTRLTTEEAIEFHERVMEIAEDFQSRKDDGRNTDEQGYALVFALYPTLRGSRPTLDKNGDS